MNAIRSILLTTDLTPLSDHAFERALRLARPGSALTILHTVEGDPHAVGADEECRVAEERLNALLKAHDAGGRHAAFRVRAGDPADEIVSQTRQRDADLVVLGVHRKSLLGDLFGKTTAEQVVAAAVAPVLTVKEPAADDYRAVMVGTDGSEASGRALGMALDAFPDARFMVVQAFHVPFGAFLDTPQNRRDFANQRRAEMEAVVWREVERRADRPDLDRRIERRLVEGETTQALLAEIARTRPDLLVIGTSGGGGGVFGNVAKTLSMNPPCDLLVVPAAGRSVRVMVGGRPGGRAARRRSSPDAAPPGRSR